MAPDHPPVASKHREELLQMKNQLEQLLIGVEKQLRDVEVMPASKGKQLKTSEVTEQAGPKRSVRDVVLGSLDELCWPTYARELTQYCKARFGRDIPPSRFGPLAKDEINAFRSSKRPVWLCFALTSDRHQAIKRLLCRSDWPLDWRMFGPSSGRVQYLKITARLCELATKFESSASDPEMLRILAADHARDLPGVRLVRGRFELDNWRDIALGQLEYIAGRDEGDRKASAAKLGSKSEFYQFFGMPDVHESFGSPLHRKQQVGS
jgi:hypothetical protein